MGWPAGGLQLICKLLLRARRVSSLLTAQIKYSQIRYCGSAISVGWGCTRACGTNSGITRVWRPIRAPVWLLLTSSPPPQARRPWLRAGRQVVRSDRPAAWAGSIRRRRRPRHQASRAKAARETRGRGRPAAAVAAGPLHAGLVVSRTHSQGLRRRANKASALASGKCSWRGVLTSCNEQPFCRICRSP